MLKTNLREYRLDKKLKQQDLADLVGVRRETISHLENASYNPSLKLAWDLAKVFNVSIEAIFSYEEEE